MRAKNYISYDASRIFGQQLAQNTTGGYECVKGCDNVFALKRRIDHLPSSDTVTGIDGADYGHPHLRYRA